MYLQKAISENVTDLGHWIIQIRFRSAWRVANPTGSRMVRCFMRPEICPEKILCGRHKSSKVMCRRIHGIQFFPRLIWSLYEKGLPLEVIMWGKARQNLSHKDFPRISTLVRVELHIICTEKKSGSGFALSKSRIRDLHWAKSQDLDLHWATGQDPDLHWATP